MLFRSPRGWQRQAPSTHDSPTTRRLDELLQPRATHALERGTLIHKWFEQIAWLDAGLPTQEQLLIAARTLPPLTIEPKEVLPEFLAVLNKPAIAAVLSRHHSPHHSLTPSVRREHPFACRFDRTLISGIIDRVVLWSEDGTVVAAELFDFKTDAVNDSSSLKARVETYRPQLDSYCRAIAQLFQLAPNDVSATLAAMEADPAVKKVCLAINSPGGTVTGVEEIANQVRSMSKPTMAYTEGEMCSAAYWIASQSDAVFATPSARVGSIGVLLPMPLPGSSTRK